METQQLPDIDIRWLIDVTATEERIAIRSHPTGERVDYPFPPEIGTGLYEQVTVEEGFNVFRSICHFPPRNGGGGFLPLGEVRSALDEPTFAVQILHSGRTLHRESAPRADFAFEPGKDFFRHSEHLEFVPLLDRASDNVMSGFAIATNALVRLLGEEIAGGLLDALQLSVRPAARVVEIPLHVSAPLRASLPSALSGGLRSLFAQAKVLEYLCLLSAHLDQGAAPPSGRPSKRKDLLIALRDELLHLDGKIPNLNDLAARCNTSARTLNSEFRHLFGSPICAFVTDHRLKQAHRALLESNIAMKRLAHRLGYSHVNNFITAFRRKFGYPPGALRARRGDSDGH